MNKVLASLTNCKACIDDVIVYSKTCGKHLKHLRALFERFVQANLVINLKNCEFAKATVAWFGHVVDERRVLPSQAKVQAILDFPKPSHKRELMRFLGTSGFYQKFCANYRTLVAPLTTLLKKNVAYVLSKVCQNAFDKLKAVLASGPVLMAPDFERAFKVAVDASDVGVGAVLLQADSNGMDRPIAYFSKKLNRYKKVYSTIEKEVL